MAEAVASAGEVSGKASRLPSKRVMLIGGAVAAPSRFPLRSAVFARFGKARQPFVPMVLASEHLVNGVLRVA